MGHRCGTWLRVAGSKGPPHTGDMDTAIFSSPHPIVAAPMAGGATTVELCAAVAKAGGFPFLAGGYQAPQALAGKIAELRRSTRDFGVNVFVPDSRALDPAEYARYTAEILPDMQALGVEPPAEPIHDDDHFDEKIALLTANPVAVVSFTFGLPERAVIAALQQAGSAVLVTVTNPEEACVAAERGVDGLVVQAAAAGGHSATFTPEVFPEPVDLPDLVGRVRECVDLPLIGAGGIDGVEKVRATLEAGASAIAVGTLLLLTDEAGTSAIHRAALADPAFTDTELTRAFTGKPARALVNDFMRRHADAPTGYPEIHHLTRPMRQAAAKAGDAQRAHLWAGTGYRHAPTGPVADVIAALVP